MFGSAATCHRSVRLAKGVLDCGCTAMNEPSEPVSSRRGGKESNERILLNWPSHGLGATARIVPCLRKAAAGLPNVLPATPVSLIRKVRGLIYSMLNGTRVLLI